MKKLVQCKRCPDFIFIFLFCMHTIAAATPVKKINEGTNQHPSYSSDVTKSTLPLKIKESLLQKDQNQEKNYIAHNQLPIFAEPLQNVKFQSPEIGQLVLIPSQPQIFEKNINVREPIMNHDQQSNPTMIDNNGVQQKIGFDFVSKTYYLKKDNNREYLDSDVIFPENVHQKIIDTQKLNVKNFEDMILEKQNDFASKASMVITIQERLSNLWKNSKIPTKSEVEEAFTSIYRTIQDVLQINITEPIKNTLFKQAIENLPDGKDQKKIDSWLQSIEKKIYQLILDFKNSMSSLMAKDKLEINENGDVAKLEVDDQIDYFCMKYSTYCINLDIYQLIHPTVIDIANKLSGSIIQEIIGDQEISKQTIDVIRQEFAKKFIALTQTSNLQQAYETLGISVGLTDQAYETLGLSAGSTNIEVVKAYKQLALKNHPDKKGGDKVKFQKIKEAYDTIITNDSENKNTFNENDSEQEKIKIFYELISSLVTDINNAKEKVLDEKKIFKNNILQKIENLPFDDRYRSLLNNIVRYGESITNKDGTTTYTMPNQYAHEGLSVTFNKEGNITSMGNIENY